MIYRMVWYVDGGCRGNGSPGSVGAAAAVLEKKYGGTLTWTRRLEKQYYHSGEPEPTNQRAEITAIIIALEQTLERYKDLDGCPRLNVIIHSDSRYAVGCMNEWVYKWCSNGWLNARGEPVANKDLISEASDLDDRVKELGSVTYEWIPREQNQDADRACNEVLNPPNDSDSDYSSDY